MAKDIVVTPEGFSKIKSELEFLKGPERMRIAEAIREAKAHGDLRENAAYHEAKLNQARLDGRIAELEAALERVKVVEKLLDDEGKIDIGSKVKLRDLAYGDEFGIKVVGAFESDGSDEAISASSPMGEALIGKGVDEEIVVVAPGGTQKYRILEIG